ncbi:alpha/beta hydrolase [Mycobacterium sp. 852002-51163_SCH5372311]|uniref:alpha/beta hydrolase n=1 Tax=Mycobacterium sp. 852002-51163_SCH5372311 TaxID=1834097 RepID=UPI000801F12F|nr:alpha/beta hydrolase [Mycobacterium sp. 852002-51163_SCH5372311]OBF83487.1 alpha/beta hydrolase [Mycobacterium sp. 852002-51163_SCH5372311]
MKKLAALAAGGLAALAARRYVAMRYALAQVEPELRSPVLPFVTVTHSAKTLPALRLAYRVTMSPGPGVDVVTRTVGQPATRVLVITPEGHRTNRPAVLALHGGGMIVGSPQLELVTHGRLARELGAVVVSPDYRLAPENPFPAALDDSMATLQWMRQNAGDLGIDADRIAVVGRSAGGGLAAAVAQRSHDEGSTLRAQGLMYPMLDDRTVLNDDDEGRGRLVWTPESNRFAWTAYLGRAPRMSDAPAYAAPARRDDLSGLPPAWIGVGELDLYYGEDVAYAEKLRACGVPCELITVPRMYHAADGYAQKAQSMETFIQGLVNHLRAHL